MFPNDHAIYLHDTPSKELFDEETRAFSHGCIRVEDPQSLAVLVLGGEFNGLDGRANRSGDRGQRANGVPEPGRCPFTSSTSLISLMNLAK